MPQAALRKKPVAAPLDAGAVLDWYDRHARTLPWRVSPADRARGVRPDPYRVWLSEIMLQQTTIAAVRDYFHRFLSRWPNVEALARAPLNDVLSEWAGLGYYARARNLHKCAQKVADDLGGRFPESTEGLLALPGIGPYTAAAIAAICHDEPVAVVDGNVERVVARYIALDVPIREAKPLIRDLVQQSVPSRAGDFAQAIMDLGATICAPRNAACVLCPLRPGCAAAALGNPADFPVKAEKPQRPVRFGHAYILQRADGAVWLRTRAGKGMLASMTEVPGSDWTAEQHAPQFPIAGQWKKSGHVSHGFTHFTIELDVWMLQGGNAAGEGWWSEPALISREALPSLFRKVLAAGDIDTGK